MKLLATSNTGEIVVGGDPSRNRVARASRESRGARPWIVLGGLLVVAWCYGIVLQTMATAAPLVTGGALSRTGLMFTAIGIGAAMVTPLVLWIRQIVRTSWSNSVQAVVLSRRLRAFAAWGFGSLGLALLAVDVTAAFTDLEPWMTAIRLAVFGGSSSCGLLAYALVQR
jgi:hypothetical protein